MTHDQRHPLRGQFAHHLQHLAHKLRVERGSDLIAQQRNRLHRQRAGDGNALLLTARELIGVIVKLVAKPHPVEHFARHGFGIRFRGFLDHLLRQHDVFTGGLMREQVELLKDHPDLLAQVPQVHFVVHKLLPVDRDRPFVDLFQAVDTTQKRRFSGAGFADQRDDFALFDVQVDALEHLGLAIAFVQSVNINERH